MVKEIIESSNLTVRMIIGAFSIAAIVGGASWAGASMASVGPRNAERINDLKDDVGELKVELAKRCDLLESKLEKANSAWIMTNRKIDRIELLIGTSTDIRRNDSP